MRQVDTMQAFEQLFEHLSGISIFSKDNNSRIMRANTLLLPRFGFEEDSEILGKTDYDLYPITMAEKRLKARSESGF